MIDRSEPVSGVVELRLNRAPVNALSPELLQAVSEALQQAVGDGARAIVISGQPGMFSAGLDVPLLLSLDRAGMSAFWRTFYGTLSSLASSPVPVGFAITGHCPAGGTVLSLFGDYRVAARGDFRLGLNETEVGLPMPAVVYRAFRRLLGTRQAEQMAVAGRLVNPEEALAIGLVDELAAPEAVVDHTLAWASRLANLPRHALEATRREARSDLVALFEGIEGAAYEQMNAVWFAPETQAALKAFLARLAARKSGENSR